MRIGIDLGGTKIEGVVLSDTGEVLYRKRLATPQSNYQQTLKAIVDLIHWLEQSIGEKASIGIGTPGAISPQSNVLRNSNSTCMNGKPVKADLERYLGREIRLANDANCFALSEAIDGSGKGAAVVFGVIIGTGTGAGIVVNSQLLTGPNAIAGEWGHNPLPWPNDDELPGPECYCGKESCIETFLSGPGLVSDFVLHGGKKQSVKSIVALANENNILAEQCLQRYENRLARSLAHVINILDPDVIVLGGGMSNIARLYQHIPQIWQQYIFADAVHTRLESPTYGDSSGVRGAAWLWKAN